MIKFPSRSCVCIVAFLLTACSEKPKDTDALEPIIVQNQNVPSNEDFDWKVYMEGQIALLDSVKPKVHKTVTTDGARETKTLDNINWKKELQPFLDIDIVKPAWKDSYSVSTVADEKDKDAYTVIYQTKDVSLNTKLMTIAFDHYGKPVEITIVNKTKNNLYASYQTLIYRPSKGYSINGSQDVNLGKKSNYSIEAKFE